MIGPNLSEWALKRPSFIAFLMIIAVAAGVRAFGDLGRDEDPPFTVRTMIVAAAWPGATVEETLSQVTERLERTLQETHKFDAVRSYTIAGQTTIFVDLDDTTDTADIPDVWYRVRRNIGDMRGTLPAGVVGPFFNDDFGDTFGIIYGFTADGFTFRELRDYVEDARSKLLQVPDVAKIEILGAQDERIFIEFSTEKLAGLRLDFQTIVGTLQAQNVLRPAGVIQTDRERVYLRVSGAFDNERDIENVNIVAGDRIYRLGDIATVRRDFVDPPTPMFRVNGKPAIGLAISMRTRADILALGKNVRATMADIRASLPVGIEPTLVADQSTIVDYAINDFLKSLVQAIIIILACSFLSLGVRPGIVVALAIPITLALVFAVMNPMHIALQRVSLGALIIALTLLVDDAMTTVDAMQRRLAAGDSKDAAASFAYRTLAAPMLIGTLVTIASFVPVGFAPGGASEVLSSLFSVVAIALIASWLVAVVFGPIIGKAILKMPDPSAAEAKPSRMRTLYQGFLTAAIRVRWLTIGVTIAMFVGAILALPLVPRQFFPSSDRPELLVDLTLRQNASIRASEATAVRVEALLKDDPDVDHYSTYVGRGAIRFYLPLSVHLANPFFSQLVVITKSIEARERLQAKLEKVLAVEFPEVVSRVSPLEMGPPVGWPLQYRIIGPDKDELRRIALDVANLMGADTRVRTINYDWMEPARQVRVHIDQDEARRLRVSSQRDCRRAAGVGHRVDDHAGARRHLPRQRGGARDRKRARVVPDAGVTAGAHTRRAHGAAGAIRALHRGAGVPTGLAARPRADADGACGCVERRAAGDRRRRDRPVDRRLRRQAAAAVPDRDRRPLRVLQRLVGQRVFRHSDDDPVDVSVHDDPADQLPAAGDGGGHPASGLNRRRRGAAAVQPAARLRRDPGHPRADRHDREKRGDPDRIDRRGARGRPQRTRRGDDGREQPADANNPDGNLDGAGIDTDRADDFLGADGHRDHGRPAGGVAAHADPAAGALRDGVRQRKDRAAGTGGRADVMTDRAVLELHVAEMRQLFNAMDPAPFRERDLDPNAYNYIVDWGREAPARQPLGLVVRLSRETATPDDVGMLRDAVHAYFLQRADATRRQLRQLFRVGRVSLLIGLAFLALVIVVGEYLTLRIDKESYGYLVKESLIIAGWVALWRPLEIFLYDWWPIRAEATLLDRLSEMTVRVLGTPTATGAAAA